MDQVIDRGMGRRMFASGDPYKKMVFHIKVIEKWLDATKKDNHEKKPKDKKPAPTKWIGKTATMAAVVAALGMSLGVNVQKVYAGEAIRNSGVVQDKHCSEQGKIESQQSKIQSQQMKYKSQHLKIDATQHKGEFTEHNLETK